MDGFDLSKIPATTPIGTYPYQYVDPQQIQPYWTIAQQYVLADHMFQTQGSGSFTAHQDLIAGATAARRPRQHGRHAVQLEVVGLRRSKEYGDVPDHDPTKVPAVAKGRSRA